MTRPNRKSMPCPATPFLIALVSISFFASACRGADPVRSRTDDDDRQFWSFRKLQKTPVPNVGAAGRARTPIDRFLLAALEAKGLSFSPDASRSIVARRVCLDLTGVPPSPGLIDAFENDQSPAAYERLVDRLLASPQFGERAGRHWLDVAGYVDTVGFDTDATNIITSEGKWRVPRLLCRRVQSR